MLACLLKGGRQCANCWLSAQVVRAVSNACAHFKGGRWLRWAQNLRRCHTLWVLLPFWEEFLARNAALWGCSALCLAHNVPKIPLWTAGHTFDAAASAWESRSRGAATHAMQLRHVCHQSDTVPVTMPMEESPSKCHALSGDVQMIRESPTASFKTIEVQMSALNRRQPLALHCEPSSLCIPWG